jgi:hypothetical protein
MNIISLGAGVQSSTMSLMAAHGEITPMPDCAIFADTQWEPKAVYEWLDWLETKLPFPVYRVTKGNLAEESLRRRISKKTGNAYFKLYVPTYGPDGPMPRKCTMDFKLAVIYRKMRGLAKIPRGCKDVRITCWVGISLDEAWRMKPALEPWVQNIWPLVDRRIRRDHCLRWMGRHGYPMPPRSACVFCPYHKDAEWRMMPADEFQQAIEFERALQDCVPGEFLHPSRVPLDQVDFSTDEDRGQLNMFNNECEGMCGV